MHVAGRTLAARLSFLGVLSLGIAAQAQKADLPAAPAAHSAIPSAPSAPSPKLDLHVSPDRPVPPPPETKKTPSSSLPYLEEAACEKAMGAFFEKNPTLRPKETPALKVYTDEAFQHLRTEWTRHMPRDAKDPWMSGIVAVRFLIEPDGNVDDVELVTSSGRRSFDDHALDAISASGPLPPLPVGNNRPVPLCVTLAYNLDPAKRVDLWPPSKSTPKQPAAGDAGQPTAVPAR
jgi:TonB family protein